MQNLASIIDYLYPNKRDYWKVQDDGQGLYIKEWNIKGVSKPTEAEIMAKEQEYLTWKTNKENALSTKKQALEDLLITKGLTIEDLKELLK